MTVFGFTLDYCKEQNIIKNMTPVPLSDMQPRRNKKMYFVTRAMSFAKFGVEISSLSTYTVASKKITTMDIFFKAQVI